MTDPQIDFQNIESPAQRLQVKDLMEDLIQMCPSDSAVIATFRFLQNHFLADIKIASESTYMQAMESGAALGDLLADVKSKLMRQIVDWRNHRFAH
jgi:hypothetical protein